ncbi:hypothetical protein HNV08_05595 [Winogradskyella eckloniae]|uniref:DUF6371 domain-containing protein n=1 Tax=Winogradskyella eckloniae TaxID=1089306 RepID=UPI0015675424|nr:DUF6371 domain-containing protein [Winogradskyella eckloniae]NRD19512.1 hypothetical protein [Winogradskyella eckloniae]
MTYKYTLDKSSKKFQCPSCLKKSFVRYVDVETLEYLESTIGRCDRESKCQYHKYPSGNKTITNINNLILASEASSHPDKVIGCFGRNYTNNNFIKYLQQHFCNTDIKNVIRKYFIGTSSHWNGATIFWQVDEQMNICAGKVMLYDKNSGSRVKKPYPHINWMHRVLQIDGFVLQQCLFGIHNLCDYDKGSTVCIVESEKTAIIMSVLFPAYLWLATGSKSNLKEELLKPLKGYNIIVFPDKTEFIDWNTKVIQLKNKGFNISCSDFLEDKSIEEGSDLVDMFQKIKFVSRF